METQGKLKLILNITMWVIIVLGLILAIVVATGSTEVALDAFLYLCYILVGGCALIGVVFGLQQFFKTLGKSKVPLYGLLAFALIVILSYAMASGELPAKYVAMQVPPSADDMKLASSLLIATYILGVGAALAAVYSAVRNAMK